MDGLKAALQSKGVVIAVLTTTTVISAGIAYLQWRRHHKRHYVPVGHVAKIYMYPVKCCRGLEVGEAVVTEQGLRWKGIMDRHLVILYKDRFLDSRTESRIVLISPQCSGDGQVRLEAPGMDPLILSGPTKNVINVSIWDIKGDAVDCGPEAAGWLEKFFGKPGYKLVMSAPGSKKRHTVDHWRYKRFAGKDDKVGFQDQTALMLTSEASLDNLNNKLTTPVAMRNFRPNIVVSGSEPFQEDDWLHIRIGKVDIRTVLPCNRCLVTTINPETGVKDKAKEPLKTLESYRLSTKEKYKGLFAQTPLFGLKCGVDQEGVVRVGDTVYAACT
ncbi:PREDICTED: mitochondrial amidoxime reducing component 2-like [Branchiostoma belcheri]|uniref:Mitochondrial amidoxime reducing component 2-like n=1 Tax=Branchiostoma belcheri TaxID=7741 RepID=A0A6P4XZA3_BRABE|nr:PREDICTED: mitochondrial amidoxime reducing component 2-like [Branchiostoma belcheri]